MIRTVRKTATAALAATVLATAALASAPAQANGSVSVHVQPRNADEERAMRAGFAIYSIVNSVRTGSSIRQNGNGNSGGIAQDGRGNQGHVYQRGNGHNGTITQNGNNNSYGLFQFAATRTPMSASTAMAAPEPPSSSAGRPAHPRKKRIAAMQQPSLSR
jgi:hypothetical protein